MPRRRQRGEGSFFYDERSGLWVGELDLGYIGGKRKRKRVTSRNQKTALAKFNAAKDDVRKGVTGKDCTLAAWLEEWLTDIVEPRLKPKTSRTYRSYCEQYLIPILGRKRLSKLEPKDLRDLHKQMRGMATHRGTRIAEATIHHAHRILGTALVAAANDGRPARPDIVKREKAPSVPKSSRGALTAAQAIAVMRAGADDPRLAPRWMAAFYLGARQGETLGLRWSHVDLDSGTVDLAWSLQRIHYVHGCGGKCDRRAASCPSRLLAVPPGFDFVQLHRGACLVRPKTVGSFRVVPLAAPMHEALRLWWSMSEHEPNPHDLVWRRVDGLPYDGRRDYEAWRRLLVKARVPQVTLHEARHTTNTLMGAEGVPEAVRMEIAGHSVAATNRLYTHADLEQRRAAMAALARALGG